MKRTKLWRVLALVLALTFVFAVAGCQSTSTSSSDSGSGSQSASGSGSGSESESQELEPVVLEYYMRGEAPKDQDMVYEEINKYLTEKINTTVNMNYIADG